MSTDPKGSTMDSRQVEQFVRKVREIADYMGDEIEVDKSSGDEVRIRTITPHYVPRGRIFVMILPNGHDVSVKVCSWMGSEEAQPDQEYSLAEFLGIKPPDFGRFGYEYASS